MVPGALLSASNLRPPTPVTVDGWPTPSTLDNVSSLTNYISGLNSALPYNMPSMSDISEGMHWERLLLAERCSSSKGVLPPNSRDFPQGSLIQRARPTRAQSPQASGGPNQPMRYFSSREISVTNGSV